ncbi:MAG: aquaporin [Alphaproteobacteria bacterium]|jgi:aquaporin Z|nr:aquaporin [Alphaproteobacteria bacterium]
MTGNMQKYVAEFVGTLSLVLIGCGSVAIGGFAAAFPVGILPVALAFGLTVTAMAYTIGPISGAHLNPAVTVSLWVAGRIRTGDIAGYIIAQVLGGIVGAGLLVVILKGKLAGYDVAASGLGQNGWGAGYGNGYGLASAVLAEFVATLLFTLVILGSTSGKGAAPFPGLVIGLTLAILHFPFVNVTGLSVNPARSLGPAVFVGGQALAQVWLFLIVPVVGGAVAGWLVKSKALDV